MLRGIDIDGIKNTPKEYVLLKALKQEEDIKGLETSLLYRAALLDRTDQSDVNEFNKVLQKYIEAKHPSIVKEREEKVTDMADQLKSLENLNLANLKFTTRKGDTLGKTGKIKII
jgi:hypothetical protein